VGTGPDGTTVRVTGVTDFNITVRDQDPAELQGILDSIRPVTADANGCGMRLDRSGFAHGSVDPATVTSVSVCLYAQDFDRRGSRQAWMPYLLYSTRVTSQARTLVAMIDSAGPPDGERVRRGCSATNGFFGAKLVVHTAEGPAAYWVQATGCLGQPVYGAGHRYHSLTKASARLWAIDGVPMYAIDTQSGNRLTPYLPKP
jgi:hypothetical protein